MAGDVKGVDDCFFSRLDCVYGVQSNVLMLRFFKTNEGNMGCSQMKSSQHLIPYSGNHGYIRNRDVFPSSSLKHGLVLFAACSRGKGL